MVSNLDPHLDVLSSQVPWVFFEICVYFGLDSRRKFVFTTEKMLSASKSRADVGKEILFTKICKSLKVPRSYHNKQRRLTF